MEVKDRPRLHARDHLPGGADPLDIQATDTGSGGFTTFPEAALALFPWAYWPCDEGSGSLVDIIGGRILAPHGTVTYGNSGPFPNIPTATAVHLNGSTGYFDLALATADQSMWAGAFTVFIWVYQDAAAVSAPWSAWSGSPSTGNTASIYTFTSNHLRFTKDSATTDVDSGVALGTLGWHPIAMTWAGPGTGAGKLYLDGSQIATLTNIANTSATQFRLGVQGSPVGNFWNGKLAQCVVYDYELSASDIATLSGLGSAASDAAEGKFLMAVGDGTTSWEFPLEVTY